MAGIVGPAEPAEQNLLDAGCLHPAHIGGGGSAPGPETLHRPAEPLGQGSLPARPVRPGRIGDGGEMAEQLGFNAQRSDGVGLHHRLDFRPHRLKILFRGVAAVEQDVEAPG